MKKLWKLLKSHVSSDFDWKLYGSVAVFLGISIFINYRFNLENGVIDRYAGKPIRILWYFLLYSTAWFGISLVVFYSRKTLHYFRLSRYWAVSLFGVFIVSCSVGFPYLNEVSTYVSKDASWLFRWAYGITNNLINFFLQAIPMFIVAWFFEKKRENFGVNKQNVDLRPYWQILALVAPMVIIASFEEGFRNYYPMYKRYEVTAADNPGGIPSYLFALGFELVYGIDFFNVEFVFRGLLVIGVSQVIGKEAILPMVGAYCFLHFGKPIGECVSSVFGGYILGVVAFYTRNIWGGVIVHVGLAWMMEIAAFVQKLSNS